MLISVVQISKEVPPKIKEVLASMLETRNIERKDVRANYVTYKLRAAHGLLVPHTSRGVVNARTMRFLRLRSKKTRDPSVFQYKIGKEVYFFDESTEEFFGPVYNTVNFKSSLENLCFRKLHRIKFKLKQARILIRFAKLVLSNVSINTRSSVNKVMKHWRGTSPMDRRKLEFALEVQAELIEALASENPTAISLAQKCVDNGNSSVPSHLKGAYAFLLRKLKTEMTKDHNEANLPQ